MAAFINVVGTPATPQFAEVLCRGEVIQSAGVRSVVQIYHFKQRPPFLYTPEFDLIQAIRGVAEGALSAALASTYTAIDWRVRYMDDPTATDFPDTNGIVGAITGDRLPTFSTVTVQIKTTARGRNFKGSKHFAPVAESDTTLDKLNAAALLRWQAVAAMIQSMTAIAPGDGSQWDLCILSPTLSDFVVNPSIFTGAVMNVAIANSIVGTMKRRKEKAGT